MATRQRRRGAAGASGPVVAGGSPFGARSRKVAQRQVPTSGSHSLRGVRRGGLRDTQGSCGRVGAGGGARRSAPRMRPLPGGTSTLASEVLASQARGPARRVLAVEPPRLRFAAVRWAGGLVPAPGLASACSPRTRLPRFPFGGSAAGLFFAPWAFSVLPLATGGGAARRGLVSVAALGSAAARAASRRPRSWVVRISLLTFWASNCWYPQMPPPAKLSRATTARVEASHSLGRLGPDPPKSAWHTLRQVHAPTPPGAWAQRPGLRPHRLPGARQVCVPVWRAEGGALARGGRARLAPHRHGRQAHDPRAQDARVDTVGGARERSGSGRVDDRHELLSLTSSLRVRASMSRRSPRTGPAPSWGDSGARDSTRPGAGRAAEIGPMGKQSPPPASLSRWIRTDQGASLLRQPTVRQRRMGAAGMPTSTGSCQEALPQGPCDRQHLTALRVKATVPPWLTTSRALMSPIVRRMPRRRTSACSGHVTKVRPTTTRS